MNQTLIGNLRYVLETLRLQAGDMAKVQADIVAQAIAAIQNQDAIMTSLLSRIEELNDLAEERQE